MSSFSFQNARRVLTVAAVGMTIAAVGLGPVSAQSTITVPGVPANQPSAPVKLRSCAALETGTTFTPQLVFDSPSNLKSSTVTFSFFDKENQPLGQVDLTPPYEPKTYPLATDTFTCAIAHEDLTDGSVFPATAHNNTPIVIGGLVGVGLIAALAAHGGSSGGTTQTSAPFQPTPSPSPTPTLPATVTPTPSATPTLAPGQTPSPSPTPTLAPGQTPSPSPTPTPTPSPTPTGVLVLNPNTQDFTSTGATATSTIMESKYTGTFSIQSNTCASGGAADGGAIATFSPAPPLSNPTTITVTSGEAGTCTITYEDATGNIAQIQVQVTLSNVVVNGKHRKPATTAPIKSAPHSQMPATVAPSVKPPTSSTRKV